MDSIMECEQSVSSESEELEWSDSEDLSGNNRKAIGKEIRMNKTYKSAIVIAPPLSVCQQIQEIRAEHDKAYERWMPHINLIYPYYENEDNRFSTEAVKLLKNLTMMKAFEIQFTADSIGSFTHGQRMVVWLKPLATTPRAETISDPKSNNEYKVQKIHSKKPAPKAKPVISNDKRKATAKPKPSHPPIHCVTTPRPKSTPEVGMNALINAYYTPESTKQEVLNISQDCGNSGWDALRFAFEGEEERAQDTPGFDVLERPYFPRYGSSEHSLSDSSSETSETSSSEESDSSGGSVEEQQGKGVVEMSEDLLEWLPSRPDGQHPNVMKLQSELEKVYPDLDDLRNKSSDGFQPHLTLGQFSISYGTKFIQRLRRIWKPIKFVCDQMQLISRNDQDPFKVIQRVPLTGIDTDILIF